jgi:ParB family chromosome partitioning protein
MSFKLKTKEGKMFFGKIKEIGKIVREVETSRIIVPENRFRKRADENIEHLAESVREHGVLEPVLVKKSGEDFVLISGERRLAAAKMAGNETVPCITVEEDEVDSAVISIIENLHRQNLNMFEEAAAISYLINITGMTQEQCARRLSVSQSYIANKIRLLKFSQNEREAILEGGLTERHSRALLRLEAGEDRIGVLRLMVERRMNVASAEEYIEALLCAQSRAGEQKSRSGDQNQKLKSRDIHSFCLSIDQAVEIVRRSGIQVESTRRETERGTLISIILPKAAG